MRHTTFAIEAEIEAEHWWFVGRRRLFAREIDRRRIGPAARVLDLGTSTGTNLRMLRDVGFSNVAGLDLSEDALRSCLEKNLGNVVKGDITRLPFRDEQADLVLATDIIEHVDDDQAAIREITRILRPGGTVLLAVPTFELLWGLQDEFAQHKRRYRKPGVERMLSDAGLIVERSYYFNYLLFLPILLARYLLRLIRPKLSSENEINSPIMNRLLGAVFAFDVATAPLIRPPFGVSAFVLATKPVR
jgi:SAM-dependent methyltransferase